MWWGTAYYTVEKDSYQVVATVASGDKATPVRFITTLLPRWVAVAAMLTASNGMAFAECLCRANGRTYEQGQIACLALTGEKQLARCEMVLNNSSWKKIQNGCPEATGGSTGSRADLATAVPPPNTVSAH